MIQEPAFERLTPARIRVLGQLAHDRPLREVGQQLTLSYNGVRSAIEDLKRITGTTSVHELVEWWRQNRELWLQWIADVAVGRAV